MAVNRLVLNAPAGPSKVMEELNWGVEAEVLLSGQCGRRWACASANPRTSAALLGLLET